MLVAGLFVGVSRAAHPTIAELQFAHVDATHLHAIFADGNLEQHGAPKLCRLIVDHEASHSRVLTALRDIIRYAVAGEAHLLLAHFSCHGSPSGTLVLHDTDPGAVDETGFAVRDLLAELSAVRNCPVIVTLDCCFAGTALGLSESPNRTAFNELMHENQDQSRIVGCAAEFGQKAYEDLAVGHGLFSHALITRLNEAHSNAARHIAAHAWIDDAAAITREMASRRGRRQTPVAFSTARGGRVDLPVAHSRPHQLRLILRADMPPTTNNVDCLGGHGFDRATIQAVRSRVGPGGVLNDLQRDAVALGVIVSHQSLLVRAPTSAGKTLIAELAVLGHQRSGRKCVILLPLRALAREHARTFNTAYGSLGLRVVVSTGDVHDDDDLLLRGQFEVAFLTFEKYCALVSARPTLQETLGLIVFDEIQTIADAGRGHTLEMLLVQVRRWRESHPWPQLVVLCGELADLIPFQRWLQLPVVASTHRPVPLMEAVLAIHSGDVRSLDREAGTEQSEIWPTVVVTMPEADERARRRVAAVAVVDKLLDDGLQVLVFCTEKPQARRLARTLSQQCRLPAAAALAKALGELDPATDHRTRAALREFAAGGVGLHVADLADSERNAVEDAFRRRELRVVVATSTLGQGVNLPADAVVFVDTERWNGTSSETISTAEYRNTAGRAGRLIPDGPSKGLSVLVAQNQYMAESMWARFVTAPPSPLGSTLGELLPEDLVLLLLRQFEHATVDEAAAALSSTYWASNQPQDAAWLRAREVEIATALGELKLAGLVSEVAAGQWTLSPLGRVAAGYGLSWLSAAAIAEGAVRLRGIPEKVDGLTLIILTLLTQEVQDCRSPRGYTVIPDSAAGPFAERPVQWEILTTASDETVVGNRLHQLSAINKWFSGAALRRIEDYFARGDKDAAVAGLFINLIHRVGSLLLAVAAIVGLHHPSQKEELRAAAQRLRGQLHIGGNRHSAALHRLRLGLTRGQCLALVGMGIQDEIMLRDAVASRPDELAALLSTPGLHSLQSRLGDTRLQARVSQPEIQIDLEEFG